LHDRLALEELVQPLLLVHDRLVRAGHHGGRQAIHDESGVVQSRLATDLVAAGVQPDPVIPDEEPDLHSLDQWLRRAVGVLEHPLAPDVRQVLHPNVAAEVVPAVDTTPRDADSQDDSGPHEPRSSRYRGHGCSDADRVSAVPLRGWNLWW